MVYDTWSRDLATAVLMTNTSLSGDYNDVGNEVPETTFASRDSQQLAVVVARRDCNNLETLGVPETSGGTG